MGDEIIHLVCLVPFASMNLKLTAHDVAEVMRESLNVNFKLAWLLCF